MSEFRFDAAEKSVPEPEPLINAERELLRELCGVGLPLWKILRQFHDYKEGLVYALAQPGHDLDDEPTRKKLKKVQSDLAACQDLLNRFEQALQDEDTAR